MTRYRTRGYIPRTPHPACPKRPPIWHNSFYYFRSLLLPRIFLSLLPLKPGTNPRTRRLLTSNRTSHPRPIRSSLTQYSCSSSIRRNCYLSPSQHHRRRTKTSNSISSTNNLIRILLYIPSRHRILRSSIHNCRRSLRLNFFCCHRIPRAPRNYWLHLPSCLPSSSSPLPLYF